MATQNPIAKLAARQHGNITRQQLLALGLKPSAIDLRLRNGYLHRLHAGVYAVGHPPTHPLQRAAAAVLACGPEAALSHLSALTLWGMSRHWSFPLHVSSPQARERPGIITHRVPLARTDVGSTYGIRATSPARTLFDCAALLPRNRFTRIAADARRERLVRDPALAELLQRRRAARGAKVIRAFLEGSEKDTRSDFEVDFLAFCARYALPTPLVNVDVNGHEVDALFPEHRLIVECDGWNFHRDRRSFEGDRQRDTQNLAAGFGTVRLTQPRLRRAPAREAAWLRSILEARGRG